MPDRARPEQAEAASNRFAQIDSALINQLLDMRLSAAEWSLYMYLFDFDPFGDRFKDLPKLSDILERLGLSKATFYRAIAKFQVEGLYEFDEKRTCVRNPNGSKSSNFNSLPREQSLTHETSTKEQSHPREKLSHPCDKKSHTCDSESHPRDENSHARDSQSHPRDNRSPEVLASMDSGSPHNIHIIHNSHKIHTLSYPAWLGSMDEPAPPEELKKIADWVREEFREWMELAKGFGFITGEITFSRKHRRPVLRREGKEPQLLEKLLEDHPLEALRSWLEEIESGIHAGK